MSAKNCLNSRYRPFKIQTFLIAVIFLRKLNIVWLNCRDAKTFPYDRITPKVRETTGLTFLDISQCFLNFLTICYTTILTEGSFSSISVKFKLKSNCKVHNMEKMEQWWAVAHFWSMIYACSRLCNQKHVNFSEMEVIILVSCLLTFLPSKLENNNTFIGVCKKIISLSFRVCLVENKNFITSSHL